VAPELKRKLDYSDYVAAPDDGVFRKIVEASDEALLAHPDWEGLEVDLTALWR